MPVVGDPKAYVFLSKHGQLIQPAPNQAIVLTLEGRVFVLTFLMWAGFLTKEHFNAIAESREANPSVVAYETGKMLRCACEAWNSAHADWIKKEPDRVVYPTDLSFKQIALLLELLIAGQANLERVAEGGRLQ